MSRALVFCVFVIVSTVAVCAQETVYTPAADVRPLQGKVNIDSVRLLAEQELFDRNLDVAKLAAFIEQVKSSVRQSVPVTAPAFELLVRVTLSSDARPKCEMSSHGDAPEKTLQAIYDGLHKLPDARTKKDSLPFELHFVIKEKT